jgi:ribosomal protein S27E
MDFNNYEDTDRKIKCKNCGNIEEYYLDLPLKVICSECGKILLEMD